MTAAAVLAHPAPLRLVGLSVAAQEAIDTDPAEVVRNWLARLNASTRRKYSLALRRFHEWATDRPSDRPEDALRILAGAGCAGAHQMVERWRDGLLAEGLASGTVAGLVAALSSLAKVLRRVGITEWELSGVAPRIEPRQDRSGPEAHELQALFAVADEAAETGKPVAVRDAAILRLLGCIGLRRSEVAGLDLQHVELAASGGTVQVLRKGKRERQSVALGPKTAAALGAWLRLRGAEPGPVFHRLDRARAGAVRPRISGEAIRSLVAAWARRAGLRRTVRPHGLRHAGAGVVASRGSLRALLSWGGWTTMTSPAKYLDDRRAQQLAAACLVEA